MAYKYLQEAAKLTLTEAQCIGCGKCEEVCPHGVFSMSAGKAEILEKDLCMECGACAENCPVNAIEVQAGVGCAQAIIAGWFNGSEPSCDCSDGKCC